MTDASVHSGVELESLVARVADEFTERQKQGERPDPEEYAARHPEAGDLLRKVLASLRLIHESAAVVPVGSGGEPAPGVLGDYRIVREAGRGGMGVVYEAEQISLARRVALKVLPFAATLDPRHLQRFQNEARAAAALEHPHIVPVYGVGCERAVHYYAMKFIDGQTLEEVIRRLRGGDAGGTSSALPGPTVDEASGAPVRGLASPSADTAPKGRAGTTTRPAARDPGHHRRVAEWGAQAAEALEYAHGMGIVHRDVKPANLMIDGQGKLWVADFGLARTTADTGLTMPGDVLGTLRYMSPEQALAKHNLVDHRTDVYALGATLYELLTLRPAVEGKDRAEVLHRITSEDPKALRSLDRGIPADLETVVLKALSKDSADRYRSAADLADDLRRFLGDRPVHARPPSAVKRLSRLLRRHRGAAVASAAGLLVCLAALAGSVGWAARDRAERRARATWAAEAALEESEGLLRRQKPREARAAAEQARVLLEQGGASASLAGEMRHLLEAADVVGEIEECRLRGSFRFRHVKGGPAKAWHYDRDEAAYRRVFAGCGIDVLALGVEEAAGRIRSSPVAWALVPALDDWMSFAADGTTRRHLLAVAQAADPDPLRARVRDAAAARKGEELAALTRSGRVLELSPVTLWLLATALQAAGERAEAVELLRRAQQRHPADFWLTYSLAGSLPRDRVVSDEAVGFYRAALALRPDSAEVWHWLGHALWSQGKLGEAEACHRESVRLKPDDAVFHKGLGFVLIAQRKVGEAAVCYREAVRLQPDDANAHQSLGTALRAQGKVEDAIACYREGVRLRPGDALYGHFMLGDALLEQGRVEEAIRCLRDAIRLMPGLASAHNRLGDALLQRGRVGDAAGCYREAIRLSPNYALAHCNLGLVLMRRQGRFAEGLRHLHRGHELGSRLPNWRHPSALWARECRRLLELEGDLPAVLVGELRPTPGQAIEYARMSALSGRTHDAALLYREAIAGGTGAGHTALDEHRYDAARAAALAGCGQGEGVASLTAAGRAAWRRQSLTWLRAVLRQRARQVRDGQDGERREARAGLAYWRKDPDLAGVRDGKALAGLPAEEAQAWRRFWADVDALEPRELQKPGSGR